MANLQRSIFYWWMGEDYIALSVDGGKVGTLTEDDGDLMHFPEEVVREYSKMHKRDGWRVVEDAEAKHIAALGNMHRHWPIKKFASLTAALMEQQGLKVIKPHAAD